MTLFRICAFALMICILFTLAACESATAPSSPAPETGIALPDETYVDPPQTAGADIAPDRDDPPELNDLRAKYPEYFDQPTGKGLELYVWKTDADEWVCGVMMGTNRNKTQEELAALKPATLEEMRGILASYDIDTKNVFIIVNDGSGELRPTGSEVAAVRSVLFPGETPDPVVCVSSHKTGDEVGLTFFAGCRNGWTLAISSVCHLPIWTFDSRKAFDAYLNTWVEPDSAAAETAIRYNDAFFENHILACVITGSGNKQYGYEIGSVVNEDGSFCVHVKQVLVVPDYLADEDVYWFVFVPVKRSDAEKITTWDADLNFYTGKETR